MRSVFFHRLEDEWKRERFFSVLFSVLIFLFIVHKRLNVLKESFALIRGMGSTQDYLLKRYFLLDRMPAHAMSTGTPGFALKSKSAPTHKLGCIFYFVTLVDWEKFREMIGKLFCELFFVLFCGRFSNHEIFCVRHPCPLHPLVHIDNAP